MSSLMVDLIVIGAGPGGTEAALLASKAGLSVAIIEKNKWGGTCLHEGCIPTKFFLHHKKDRSFDFAHMQAEKNVLLGTLESDLLKELEKTTITRYFGKARFLDDHHVDVNGQVISGSNIIIASGSSPNTLPMETSIGIPILNSNDVLQYQGDIPDKVVVIGGGYIGLEMSTLFLELGSYVHLIESSDHLLGNIEQELSKRLANLLAKKGLDIHLEKKVQTILNDEGVAKVILSDQTEIDTKMVISAVGRHPNLRDLGLEALGVKVGSKGILVNEYYQTNFSHIYAIGDCVGIRPLAHQASHEASVVISHLRGEPIHASTMVPLVVFTHPEVASIGATSQELTASNISFKSTKVPYRSNSKSLIVDEADGFIKVLVGGDGRLLGAHIIGYQATELIHQFALIIHSQLPLAYYASMVFAHPTQSELIRNVILASMR